MTPISVVIITKNEAHVIGHTLKAIQHLTNDVIVVDSGSTDGTQDIVRSYNARLIETSWDGFGKTKNKGIANAKYDWILGIDADEIPDQTLLQTLEKVDISNPENVYNINFKTFLGNKLIRFGEWGKDAHVRLFNRTKVKWDNKKVHEQLVFPPGVKVHTIKGHLLHYTMKDMADYATKMTGYALLNAERYYLQGKKSGWLKRNVSPTFSFVQNYFLKLGFLDGRQGYLIARMTSYYTFLKYARLYELQRAAGK